MIGTSAPLKRVATIKARVGWKGLTSDEFEVKSHAYLVTGRDFRGRYIDWNTCYQVSEERYDDDPFIQLRNGDLLVTKDGTIGKVALVDGLDKPACLNSGVFVVRPRDDLETSYLYWILQSEVFSDFISEVSRGSTIQHLYQEEFRELRIPLCELEEQRAIADYLDRETAQIDAFIAKNEELVALLTERRAAAIELTVAPAVLPSGWKSCQVRRLGPKSQSGVSVNGYSVPAVDDEVGVLKTGAVSKGFFDPTENKRVIEEDLARVAAPVRSGTLIVNRANTPELVGSAGYVAEDHPTLYLSDKLWQLTFESADAAYMHYWTKSDAYRSQLRGLSVGASSSMQNLSYGDFLSVWISIPPMQQQAEIVARLNRDAAEIDAAIDIARRGVELARERRAALISAAVRGKIDVGVAA